ncbi:MAG: bifunctional glycosyltransferase/class I SAM-dependent methyltransferase [Ilumatobacteraceae bacterium]
MSPKGRGLGPRIGVLVVAYNAASTLASVLDRLPQEFRSRVDHVLVCDDASHDATHLIAVGYQTISDLPLTVVKHPRNLGYGGNQKSGYRWAIEHGLDIIVLLHGDGQYQPEVIESLIEPIESGRCDAVFGSRMMVRGAARSGGMPIYKWVGNKILTRVENAIAGMELSEWHSGYRAYSVEALRQIDFEANSDGFDFDTQIILQLHGAGKQIHEVPIPTYYGDEICHVNGLRYARDIVGHVARYRLAAMGFGGGMGAADEPYAVKHDPGTSHGRLVAWTARLPPSRVLDLGCSDGSLAKLFTDQGHTVTGVDLIKHDDVAERVSSFVEADLEDGVPLEVGDGYDVIIAADVVEHLSRPDRLLGSLHDRLGADGVVLVSVPNVSHWYPRARIVLGKFDYDRRGILDAGHLRFFTRRSFIRLTERAGYVATRCVPVGLPLEVLSRSGSQSRIARRIVSSLDHVGLLVLPGLFAFQYVVELRPAPSRRTG